MSAHEMLILVMAIFAGLGALDRICGDRFGLGKEFADGIQAMGALALAMLGIICLAPVLASILKPIVVPVFSFLGADLFGDSLRGGRAGSGGSGGSGARRPGTAGHRHRSQPLLHGSAH